MALQSGPEGKMQRVVLIAEDTKTVNTVKAVLGNPDCEIMETADPAIGLDYLRRPNVACVMVDCAVEDLTRQMRHLLQYSAGMAAIPVLWIAPLGAQDPLARELGLSRLNVLPKPFTPLQLLERVQQSIWIGPYVPAHQKPVPVRL